MTGAVALAVLATVAGAAPGPPRCDDGNACTVDSRAADGSCRHVEVARCGYPHAATVLPLPSGSACTAISCPIPDTDGDGLNDAWEEQGGIDLDCNGAVERGPDLLLPDADPGRPDVYLLYDYMVLPDTRTACRVTADCESGQTCSRRRCRGHSHRPQPAAIQAVVDAFAREGIALHVERGRSLTHSTVVTFEAIDPVCAGDDAVHFYDVKRRSFGRARGLAHHYAVFGHYNTCDSIEHCGLCPPQGGVGIVFGTGGKAELPGNDLIVSTGGVLDAGLTPAVETEAGLLMHELGHNLALRHGGDADLPEFKPNYLSAVNNSFTYTGIPVAAVPGSAAPIACQASEDCPAGRICGALAGACVRIDYSGEALPDLDEAALDEAAGLGATTADVTTYNCPDTTPVSASVSAAAIDWNCNGDDRESAVAADVNADGALGTLTGHADWPNLLLEFQCTANGSADPPRIRPTWPREMAVPDALRRR